MSRRSTWRDRAALLGALGWERGPVRVPSPPRPTGTRAGSLKPRLCGGWRGSPLGGSPPGSIFSTASLSHLAHSPSLIGQQAVPFVPEVVTAPRMSPGRGWGECSLSAVLRRWGPGGLSWGHRTRRQPYCPPKPPRAGLCGCRTPGACHLSQGRRSRHRRPRPPGTRCLST